MGMKDSIVLYAALGRGHLVSMVELGNLILTHHPSLSINILFLTPPSDQDTPLSPTAFSSLATANYIASVTAATPSISFHRIPPISVPAILPPHILTSHLCRSTTHHLHRLFLSLSKTTHLRAVVFDFFNHSATSVTKSLNIPSFFYYTSGASSLSVQLHTPVIHETTTASFKDLGTCIRIPGLPVIYSSVLPNEVQDRASESYGVFLDIAKSLRSCDGVIVNTCKAFEENVVRALREGFREGKNPHVFCIGPVISEPCKRDDESGCLRWLNSQPSKSIVFLSFGSMGRFSKVQLEEIAVGLEKSEQRFLWVVRSELDWVDSELDELLPEGFLERTKERGMVVRDWAPQAEILSHDSVGGFVTHCGWNSVLEAVCEGVPMVAWPLYAEQRFNSVILVEEMKVALGVNKGKDGLVSGTELGERVKEVMDSERGKEIRKRIFKMKISATEAMARGGSSVSDLNKLVEAWREH